MRPCLPSLRAHISLKRARLSPRSCWCAGAGVIDACVCVIVIAVVFEQCDEVTDVVSHRCCESPML
jgi:hypothetical protein